MMLALKLDMRKLWLSQTKVTNKFSFYLTSTCMYHFLGIGNKKASPSKPKPKRKVARKSPTKRTPIKKHKKTPIKKTPTKKTPTKNPDPKKVALLLLTEHHPHMYIDLWTSFRGYVLCTYPLSLIHG